MEVADTGPLLHLHEIGALHLLQTFVEVHITPQIARELKPHAPQLQVPVWLRVGEPTAQSAERAAGWVTNGTLHAGEAEALAYAQFNNAALFLTDDTAARKVAAIIGMPASGTLGIVLRAFSLRQIGQSEAAQHLHALIHHSSLWISDSIRAKALQALEELSR